MRRLAVLLFFSMCAYVIVPFSSDGTRVLTPPAKEPDAILATLLVSSGMDKLQTDPRSFYDTAILYPDRNQLRSTEPFLGFAILGLPLRIVFHLSDSDVYETLRWIFVFVSLIYAYLLFRIIGIDVAISVAGAVLCVSQPGLLNGIERLQILSIPLILPVLYHGVKVWMSGALGHSVGLFLFAALYPLWGMINAVIAVMGGLFVLPLLLKMVAAQRRPGRLAACLVPILLAGVLDALALAPWMLDRADIAVYVGDAFLAIKHWKPMEAPVHLQDISGFVTGWIGPGMAVALAALGVSIAIARMGKAVKGDALKLESAPPAQAYFAVVCVLASGLALASSHPSGRLALPWLQLAFQVTCYVTLLMYWRRQLLFVVSSDQNGIRNAAVMLGAGLGVFLCLMSFGPVYVSNNNPLASHIMRVLLYMLPPLKSIREFNRIWIMGVLFLSVYVTVRLGMAVRLTAPIVRVSVAAAIVAAAMSSLYSRPLVASGPIEAPPDFFALAAHSRRTGGLYVHPNMQWNTLQGLWMIPSAKVLGRPIVNGSLGIAPPWFYYAGNVLHRFPDAEALWLMRKWNVDTVVSLVGNIEGAVPPFANKVFESASGVVYDITAPPEDTPHPSGQSCAPSEGRVPVAGALPRAERVGESASLNITVPRGFAAKRVEVSFGQPAVELVPESVDVYARQGDSEVRLNQDHSGEWLASLAADAYVRHGPAVATIQLDEPQRGQFQLEFHKSQKPPVERITLCGEWTR